MVQLQLFRFLLQGDFVPTSDLNKIICSIFIYFGVACIGLLLGSYIAGMLDDKARRDQKEKQIDSCPNCARIRMVKECALRRSGDYIDSSFGATQNKKFMSERMAEGLPMNPAPAVSHHHHSHQPFSLIDRPDTHSQNIERGLPNMSDILMGHGSPASPILTSSSSPMQFLGRQSHTRHASFDVGQQGSLLRGVLPTGYGATSNSRARSIPVGGPDTSTSPHIAKSRLRTIASSDNLLDGFSESDAESSIESTSTESSTEEVWDSAKSRIQAGKYVVLTLRLALVNSLVIIAVGCVGFWLIEGFSLIDSWYFTTVLLTTVG